MCRLIVIALSVVMIVGCGEEDQPEEPIEDQILNTSLLKGGIIVPGEQAAGIRLGDDASKVKTLYGEPEIIMGCFCDYPIVGITLTIHRYSVIYISLKAPNKSKTAGGNGIGSTPSSVEEEFGTAEEIIEDARGKIEYWYLKKGVKFEFDSKSRVMQIYIFEPLLLPESLEL